MGYCFGMGCGEVHEVGNQPVAELIKSSVMRFLDAVRSWLRTLSDVDKFVFYMRWSLHAGVLVLLFVSFQPAWESRDLVTFDFHTVLWVVMTLTHFLVVTVVLERVPELNSKQRPHADGWKNIGLSLFWITVGVAMVVTTFSSMSGSSPVMAGAVVFAFGCVGLVYSTFSRYPWVKTIIAAVATFIAVKHQIINSPAMIVGFTVFVVGISRVSMWSSKTVKELDRARNLESQLQVSDQRLRFAQELHDTLGQHLAAMSVKTELAIALDKKGDPRITEELLELQKLIRLSRTDMGQVVEGYRGIDPKRELDGARALLSSVGIAVTVTGEVSDIPTRCHDTAAWFIREAATNVVKHADATVVTFELSPRSVTVTNDGATAAIGQMGGLAALRQRAATIGAQIVITGNPPEFSVELKWG